MTPQTLVSADHQPPVGGEVASAIPLDGELIKRFLDCLALRSSATEAAYKKELARFWTWLGRTRDMGRPVLATLTAEDLADYLAFLRGPLGLEKPGASPVGSLKARYLKLPGTLAPASVSHAMALLQRFFEYVRDAGLRTTNPVKHLGIKNTRKSRRERGERRTVSQATEHVLLPEDMQLVLETLDVWASQAATTDAASRTARAGIRTARQSAQVARARWIVYLAYLSFLRIHELVDLQMGDITRRPDGSWEIYVHQGKGASEAETITAPLQLIDELRRYRQAMGLFPMPYKDEGDPAILPVGRRDKTPLTTQAIYLVIKGVFNGAAQRSQDSAQVARLEKASPHWLRHTGITHALNRGADIRAVQKQARHSSLTMTAQYDHGPEKGSLNGFTVEADRSAH